ncbi:hypothetical protein [Mucilaginibacter sp. OK098]|uniref:hypothetical protein n=1 Tax=Mucilaginibacter sp. OK098 TaxID=1855297 RepID=UPI0009153DFE|nr:hypothetical protein [Mucilaginibacter sp. OK098]SHL89189.1 hypothetical protein SAMN05216524_10183 [Mucilaginibacter sp. OK098]
MKALIFITVTGGLLASSLLECSQLAKYDLFYHADHKTITVKKCCCNQNKIARATCVKKSPKA